MEQQSNLAIEMLPPRHAAHSNGTETGFCWRETKVNKAIATFAHPGREDGRNVSVVLLIHSNFFYLSKM